MEIVIKISDEVYNHTQEYEVGGFNQENDTKLFMAIKNGIPLPKGHGNLIDYDDLIAKLDTYGRKNIKYQLPYSPTIIFADEEVQDEDSN